MCDLLELLRHRNVRKNHAFLDEAVRFVARAQLDRPHPLTAVDHELRLGGVEIERAAAARARYSAR